MAGTWLAPLVGSFALMSNFLDVQGQDVVGVIERPSLNNLTIGNPAAFNFDY
jgi:hypothetical protein